MESLTTWPPTNLSQWSTEDLRSLVDACQVEEMGPWFASGDSGSGTTTGRSSFWLALIQMVALLRLGEYGHARHVYRRWSCHLSEQQKQANAGTMPVWTKQEEIVFQSWWRIGQAMMTNQQDVVWTGLWDMMQVQQPEPFRTYAQEVADAYYHQRLLPVLNTRTTSSISSKSMNDSASSDPLLMGRQVPALALYLKTYQGWKCEENAWKPPSAIISKPPGPNSTSKELLQLVAFLENPRLHA